METETIQTKRKEIKAEHWFQSGERLSYDLNNKKIVRENGLPSSLKVWNKVVGVNHKLQSPPWYTMMPGFPDGSFGWAATEEHLSKKSITPRLYPEYIGMGDSDKPVDYKYSAMERADMIEALWKYYQIEHSMLITFDFSSLVALELLSRQITKEQLGEKVFTRINKVLFINGGLFADAHSHPILTTPLLKTSFGKVGAQMAQNSSLVFNMMMKDLWSKEYGVTKEELAENHKAISRREGTFFLSAAARFVDEHKENAKRWDLERIFHATYPEVKYIVAGSEKDQFEYKQVRKAKNQLQEHGLEIEMYPGGHMTTSEHPDLIAKTIKKLSSI